MTTAGDTALATRRATVVALRAQNKSFRTIAEELGVTKDVVYRDLKAVSRDTATPSDQGRSASVAPEAPGVAVPPATPVSRLASLSRDTPAPATAPPATPTVPCLTIPLDQALIADLATLTRNGTSAQDAIRDALALVAHTYRQAWDAGIYPRDVNPRIAAHRYVPHEQPARETLKTTTPAPATPKEQTR